MDHSSARAKSSQTYGDQDTERAIEAATTIQVRLAKVCSILLHDPGAVFGYTDDVEQLRDSRVFRTELSLDLGAGASVHQKVTLRQGLPQSAEGGLVLPLTWQATGRERLLPSFDGELEIVESTPGRTTLRLIGIYTVPLGVLGSVANSAVGRRLARRSLGALVERFRHRIECEAARRLDSVDDHRVPLPLAAPAYEHSEIYVG
jgi:hypothetical protein